MTYVVTDKCIKCKYTDCVEVCPVDCFHEGKTMLVINPEECIDCGVCIPECPIGAIIPDTQAEENNSTQKFIFINSELSKIWKNITEKKSILPKAKIFEIQKNKFDRYI